MGPHQIIHTTERIQTITRPLAYGFLNPIFHHFTAADLFILRTKEKRVRSGQRSVPTAMHR